MNEAKVLIYLSLRPSVLHLGQLASLMDVGRELAVRLTMLFIFGSCLVPLLRHISDEWQARLGCKHT
jgi:hypothetical protein